MKQFNVSNGTCKNPLCLSENNQYEPERVYPVSITNLSTVVVVTSLFEHYSLEAELKHNKQGGGYTYIFYNVQAPFTKMCFKVESDS